MSPSLLPVVSKSTFPTVGSTQNDPHRPPTWAFFSNIVTFVGFVSLLLLLLLLLAAILAATAKPPIPPPTTTTCWPVAVSYSEDEDDDDDDADADADAEDK